jgi:hypothetical protein
VTRKDEVERLEFAASEAKRERIVRLRSKDQAFVPWPEHGQSIEVLGQVPEAMGTFSEMPDRV